MGVGLQLESLQAGGPLVCVCVCRRPGGAIIGSALTPGVGALSFTMGKAQIMASFRRHF